MVKIFENKEPFLLECGETLPGITLAYQTFGKLNADKSNVVWVCHALTANSNVMEWWPGVVGENKLINPENYFIVCVNIPGSCYGSSGPLSINPESGEPWYSQFPLVTIRDMVKAFQFLKFLK